MTPPEFTIHIDNNPIPCSAGMTILEAADNAGIYIPRLCHHPDLPPTKDVIWRETIWQGNTQIISERIEVPAGEDAHCNLCLVEIEGLSEPVNSCITLIEDGMVINTSSTEAIQRRKKALAKILSDHPHACLTCAQREGCSRTDCSTNVPVEERCCFLLGRCELGKVCDYIGIPGDTQKYLPGNRPKIMDDPLFDRDYNLCIGCLRCVRACYDLRKVEVLGTVWKDGQAWVGTRKSGALLEADCRFCGACVEVCPTGALLDKEGVPTVRADCPLPCVGNCPAGIDIPGYLRLIAEDRDQEALELIYSSVPFPGILGYVCFHPCEDNCRRGFIDEPVAICALKRYVADSVNWRDAFHRVPLRHDKACPSDKKVAIIGAGPAGLTAAFYLHSQGHDVSVFDQAELPGGMLRRVIPDYRLPSNVLNRELKALEQLGIEFQMNHRFGGGQGIQELQTQGFDAIILALGTSLSKPLSVEGTELPGIYLGLEFLESAKKHRTPNLHGQVVVIGGGNVAIDAAMTAFRLGAEKVHLVCLESREEMPAHQWEIDQAESEGVIIHNSWGPERFRSGNGKVSGVDLKKCTRVFDDQGRFHPEYDTTITEYLPADFVIITIGQEVDKGFFAAFPELQTGSGGTVKVDDTLSTTLKGIFAAGDVIRGPSSVVEAIADGRRVADTVDRFLGGNGISAPKVLSHHPNELNPIEAIHRSKQKGITLDPATRKNGFIIIEETLSPQDAKLEAERCLSCHLRQLITQVILPPELWLPLNLETVELIPETEGVFQLLNTEKKILRISGTANLRSSLLECVENPGEAAYFLWELDPMFTKRESELIQHYLQEHGEMPGGGASDLDDLF